MDLTVRAVSGGASAVVGGTAVAGRVKVGAGSVLRAVGRRAVRKAAFGLAAVLGVLGVSHSGTQVGDRAAVTAAVVAPAGQGTAPVAADDGGRVVGGHLTTTFHHPFFDETRAGFVDAADLHPGDVLQTPTGTAQVTAVRLYHAHTTTYDLTIGTLHTYYVEAGNTPVLVHNCDGYDAGSHEFDLDKLDDIDAKHGPQVADGVEYQIKRMHDGSASSADHELPGIGHDPDALADFFAKFKNRQFTHYDPRPGQGSSQAEALHITMKEGEDEVGVVVLRQTHMIHAYRMTEENFNRIYTPKGP